MLNDTNPVGKKFLTTVDSNSTFLFVSLVVTFHWTDLVEVVLRSADVVKIEDGASDHADRFEEVGQLVEGVNPFEVRPEEVDPLVEGANSSEVRPSDGLEEGGEGLEEGGDGLEEGGNGLEEGDDGLQEVVNASEVDDGLEDVTGLVAISSPADDPELDDPELDHAAELNTSVGEALRLEEVGRLEEATP